MKIKNLNKPSFEEEKRLWKLGFQFIVGIDEVGRGAFAGPVVASAVIFAPCPISSCRFEVDCTRCQIKEIKEINDSKLLSAQKRENLAEFIKQHAYAYSIAEIEIKYINKFGIGYASHMAYRKALSLLPIKPDFILMDGFPVKHVKRTTQKAIVKGDRISISIAAASILAKVYRDSVMKNMTNSYKIYDFATNKGYGTKKHREALNKYGKSPVHRTSFNLDKYCP